MNFLKIKDADDMIAKTGKSVAECIALAEAEIKRFKQ